ncbi:MAG TPA: iron ABC transporter permease [Candidatus Aphodousia gallistercoris]|nr:iron ABC transporter permease [Candidatus Aphodousia gallistercoris]
MTSASNKDNATKLTVLMLWLLLGVFVVYPLCRLFAMTFWVDGQFTFENLMPFIDNWYDRRSAVNSIVLGCCVGLAGTALGFVFAFVTTRMNLPTWLKLAVSAITILPLISPPFTSSIALTLLLGPNGMVLQLLGLDNFNFYGFWGTFISETLTFFPVAFMTISTILARIDPNLEDAAYSLGASSSSVFRTVTLPLAAPGIANAFLLVFSCSLADFATPQVLGGHSFPVLPTQAYLQITGMYDFKGGAALSFMLLIPALVVYAIQNYWVGKKSYVTVSGKAGGRSSIKGPGTLISAVMALVVVAVIAFIIAIYAVILVGSLVKVWGVNNTITLDNYTYVLTFGIEAIKDTLIIACIATPLGGLLAVLVGYVTARLKVRGRKTLETISLLNYTLPGTVVGIAYIIAFNDKPLILTGTLAILVAAYLFRYSSAGIRNVIAALTQIDPSIEEASRSLGAGSARTFVSITIPLVLPAVLSGMKYLFIHSMTAISATIFLVSVNWTLITTRILECMTELQFAQACAFSVILILLVFAASATMTLLAKVLCRTGDHIGVK